MKRHPALVPLSEDHHHALVLARTLRLASEAGDDSASESLSREVAAFWRLSLRPHFRAEEKWLFPAARKCAASAERSDVALDIARMLGEHKVMRRLVRESRARGVSAERRMRTLARLATVLHDHVRFEERVFFPKAEELIPAEEMQSLAEILPSRLSTR